MPPETDANPQYCTKCKHYVPGTENACTTCHDVQHLKPYKQRKRRTADVEGNPEPKRTKVPDPSLGQHDVTIVRPHTSSLFRSGTEYSTTPNPPPQQLPASSTPRTGHDVPVLPNPIQIGSAVSISTASTITSVVQRQPDDMPKNKVSKMEGHYNFSKPLYQFTGWCYKHHHAIEQEDCLEEDEKARLTLADALIIPWTIQGTEKAWAGKQLTLYEECLDELKRFSRLLHKYESFVGDRDRAQQHLLDLLQQYAADDESSDIVIPKVHKYFEKNNCIVAEYIGSATCITRHCYFRLLEGLLQEMHAVNLGSQIKPAWEVAQSSILGLYEELREYRGAQPFSKKFSPELNADLLKPGLWIEYKTLIGKITLEVDEKLRSLSKEMDDAVIWITKMQPLQDLYHLFVSGGFGTDNYWNRLSALPNLAFNRFDSQSLVKLNQKFLERSRRVQKEKAAAAFIPDRNQ